MGHREDVEHHRMGDGEWDDVPADVRDAFKAAEQTFDYAYGKAQQGEDALEGYVLIGIPHCQRQDGPHALSTQCCISGNGASRLLMFDAMQEAVLRHISHPKELEMLGMRFAERLAATVARLRSEEGEDDE